MKGMKEATGANFLLIMGILNPKDEGGQAAFHLKQNKSLDSHAKMK